MPYQMSRLEEAEKQALLAAEDERLPDGAQTAARSVATVLGLMTAGPPIVTYEWAEGGRVRDVEEPPIRTRMSGEMEVVHA